MCGGAAVGSCLEPCSPARHHEAVRTQVDCEPGAYATSCVGGEHASLVPHARALWCVPPARAVHRVGACVTADSSHARRVRVRWLQLKRLQYQGGTVRTQQHKAGGMFMDKTDARTPYRYPAPACVHRAAPRAWLPGPMMWARLHRALHAHTLHAVGGGSCNCWVLTTCRAPCYTRTGPSRALTSPPPRTRSGRTTSSTTLGTHAATHGRRLRRPQRPPSSRLTQRRTWLGSLRLRSRSAGRRAPGCVVGGRGQRVDTRESSGSMAFFTCRAHRDVLSPVTVRAEPGRVGVQPRWLAVCHDRHTWCVPQPPRVCGCCSWRLRWLWR